MSTNNTLALLNWYRSKNVAAVTTHKGVEFFGLRNITKEIDTSRNPAGRTAGGFEAADMNYLDLLVNAAIWLALAICCLQKFLESRARIRAYQAIRKGCRLAEKYRLLKRIS